MEKEEQIKVAITAGIVALILLILILFLALSGGKKGGDDKKLADNIAEYASLELTKAQISADISSSDDASGEASSTEAGASASTDKASEGKSSVAYSEYLQTAKGDVSGNSFYATTGPLLKDVYKVVTFDLESQLKEMATYWSEGNTEAVRDLAHLERFEAMSYSLKGKTDFYYYGDLDVKGLPNGKGLAVYADDQYYYGDWSEGVRSGEGSWFAFYPLYSTYVVTEHMYAGSWANDKPNGQGQEHYDYNPEYMNNDDVYLQNAIGGFKDGLFDGDMYIINVDKNGECDEWLGKCASGSFLRIDGVDNDKKGNVPVLKMRLNEKTVFYMSEKKNKNLGVNGIITGGTIRR